MGHSPNPLNLFPMLFLCEYTIFGSSYCQLSSHLRICSSWCLQDLRSALAHEEPSLTQHPSFILQDAGSGNVLKDDECFFSFLASAVGCVLHISVTVLGGEVVKAHKDVGEPTVFGMANEVDGDAEEASSLNCVGSESDLVAATSWEIGELESSWSAYNDYISFKGQNDPIFPSHITYSEGPC